jgi:carboxypeptidase family protein
MILGLWAVVAPAVAQEASATVTGVVSDPSGAAIPNAQINLTNLNTAVVRTTKTNNDGAYAFLNVVPGRYTVQASAGGFASVTQSAVTLEVNQTATFDFHLAVGDTKTSVTVEAAAASVEASTAELGTVVATQQVNDLPLNGRNFTQLLTITPGVANINRDQSGTGGRSGRWRFRRRCHRGRFLPLDQRRARPKQLLPPGRNQRYEHVPDDVQLRARHRRHSGIQDPGP